MSHRVCSIGAQDYASQATDTVDLTVIEHGGIHLLFESESDAHAKAALDSPASLFITDVDSECEVYVDGTLLQKGVRTRVRPGSKITMGEQSYIVNRNVIAHA